MGNKKNLSTGLPKDDMPKRSELQQSRLNKSDCNGD